MGPLGGGPSGPLRWEKLVLGHRVNAVWGSSVARKITPGVTHNTTVPPRGKCEPGQKLPPTRAAPYPCPNTARVNTPMGLASLGLGTHCYTRGVLFNTTSNPKLALTLILITSKLVKTVKNTSATPHTHTQRPQNVFFWSP